MLIPVERIQDWAAIVSPADVGTGVFLVGVLFALVFSLVRARDVLIRSLPLLAYLVAAPLLVRQWLIAPTSVRVGSSAVLAVLLLWHFWLWRSARAELAPRRAVAPPRQTSDGEFAPSIEDPFRPPAPVPPAAAPRVAIERPSRFAGALLVLGFVLTAFLLFDDLGDYAGTLLAWESPVQSGFTTAISEGAGFAHFLFQRLLWDDGVLSAGDTSLFFGPPTYALMRWVSATPWTLRVASAVATLLSVALLFVFVRRHFGRVPAIAATIFFGLNTPILFYGRYGSSIAGTILAVVIAFIATWSFLRERRWTLARAIVCGVALFVATLQYAPARLAVLFLLALIPFALIVDRRRATWRHWVGVVIIAAMAAGFWTFETVNRREHYFLHARGEQVFGLFRSPNTIPALVGVDRSFAPAQTGTIDRESKIEIVRMLLGKTHAELIELLAPNPKPRAFGAVVAYDPPPMSMYFAPLAVLIGIGLVRSLVGWRSWQYAATILFSVGYCAVLLFTNRIDPHRGVLLLIPMAIWLGLGVLELGEQARRLRVPRAVLGLLAVVLMASAVFSDVFVRYGADVGRTGVTEKLADEIEGIDGPVWFWFARDHREVSWLDLRLFDKQLRSGKPTGAAAGGVLPQAITDGLRADKGGPRNLAVREVARMAREGTVLLGPRTMFLESVQKVQAMGLRAAERKAMGFPYLRIDGGARRSRVSDAELGSLLSATPVPTMRPVTLSQGPRVFLSELKPISVEFGFAEPRMDATWQGNPVVMGGTTHRRAIGTHAWTVLRYAVPEDAIVLQAIVGLSDEMRACEAASVQFEVRSPTNESLWKSPVIDFATPPMPIEIPIGNLRELVLITGEAEDGRDCDHANWGSAAFLLRERRPTPTPAVTVGFLP